VAVLEKEKTFVLPDPLTEDLKAAIEETGQSVRPLLRDWEEVRGRSVRERIDLSSTEFRTRLAREFGERVQDALAIVGYRAAATGRKRVPIAAKGEFATIFRDSTPMRDERAKEILPSIIAALRAFADNNRMSGAWGELLVMKTRLFVRPTPLRAQESKDEVRVIGGLALKRKR
jgi:hypothetical protein